MTGKMMLEKSREIAPKLLEWRRDFHMHPELGFEVTRTAARVAEIASSLGCRIRTGVGKTGVVAELGDGKPLIALRADMDALPIQEANSVDYCSQVPGQMHACGHDSHTAMLLGVIDLLSREQFPGTVRFIFQPSEESADENGMSGAPAMVAGGALDGVDMVLALHVDPTLKVGDITVEAGPSSGGVDSWFGTVIGKGGHGAHPQVTVDPVYLAAHVIFALNAMISRRISAFDPAVVSIGSIHAGGIENVIPERVELSGTLRYTEKRVRELVIAEIERSFSVVKPLGGDYELRIETGEPPMLNHPSAVELIRRAAAGLLGSGHVLLPEKDLGAEDFGAFLELIPGAMFMLGVRIEADVRTAHNPRFDIDESAMPVGTAVLAEAAMLFLKVHST